METLLPVPARGWNSLFGRLFGGRRRRRPALPLPVYSSVDLSLRTCRDIYNKPIGCVILEEIMQRTLSYLRTIDENLEYWWSKNSWGSSYTQIMYFMIFERGPGAFVEATCPRLTRLGNNGGPSQSLFGSAYNIISTNIHVLKSIKRCLAVFLAEVYQQADIAKEGLTGSHRESLCTLFIVLNHVFAKLEELHRKVDEGQTLLFTQDGNPTELKFKRLPEVDINSSQWTDAFSANAVGLIYQNLEKLDNFVSSLLSRHKKPTHMTLYWFPYTCGAIGFSLCSLWLLRHSSLMGSSDDYNLVRHAKESFARFWSDPVEPIVSVGEGPFEAMQRTGRPAMEKQQNEESLRRILLSFSEKPSKTTLPQYASGEALMEFQRSILELDQVAKANVLDLEEAILRLDRILEASKTSFAILAFGLPLLLFFRVLARVTHIRSAKGRESIGELLIVAHGRLMEFNNSSVNGEEDEAIYKFGLTLDSLDRLYEAVELHGNHKDDWTRLKEYIFCLAKPGVAMEDKLDALSRMKRMYKYLRYA